MLLFPASCQQAQEQAGVVCSRFLQPFASPAAVGAAGAVAVNCSSHRNRMGMGDSNPAAVPHAAEDIQGDDRWMSQVRLAGDPPYGGCWARLHLGPRDHNSLELAAVTPVSHLCVLP